MSNKDIIEDIKAKLKDAPELPYREGSWERFAAQKGEFKRPKVILFKRLASIAAAGLAVLSVSLYLYKSKDVSTQASNDLVQSTAQAPANPLSDNSTQNNVQELPSLSQNFEREEPTLAYSSIAVDETNKRMQVSLSHVPTINTGDLVNYSTYSMANVDLKYIQPRLIPMSVSKEESLPHDITLSPSAASLAHQTIQGGINKDVDQIKQATKMSLGDKFQLGLYVSPHRTSDRFDVGVGFLVSYALSKNISIRTGTSYNSYSVGVLKDPMETANAERVSLSSAKNQESLASDLYSAASPQMILPNINAVMGRVEAIEIPLDVSYQFKKGFYTSAGVSYSAIINQEREAKYIDNAGVINLQDKASLIPGAAEKVSKAEVKTVKSLQDNVNPNGFSGFANFSIGKKMNINNKMSLSLEPFVKVPIGQFRKSDLDYTNSGVRIITTF